MKTESWHNHDEGDCAHPIDRDGSNKSFYKKGFWKRYDRKKFLKWKVNKAQLVEDVTTIWDLEDNEFLTDNNEVVIL